MLHCSLEAAHAEGWKCGKPDYDDKYALCPYALAILVENKKIIVWHAIQTRTILIQILEPIDTVGQLVPLTEPRSNRLDETWDSPFTDGVTDGEQLGARQVRGLPPTAFV